jgi:TonB family protein
VRRSAACLVCAILVLTRPVSGQEVRREESAPAAPQLTSPPALLQGATPEYPPEALAQGRTAEVPVRLHIDASGAVTQVDVVQPAGHGFDEAAVAAARQYLFKPAEWDGVPGPIVVETTIRFVLEKPPEPPPQRPPAAPTGTPPGAHAGDRSQPIAVAGSARERGTRRRLAGVQVTLVELGLEAITDQDGAFYFHGVPPGSYRLEALDTGFDRFARPLAVAADERVDVTLYLRPSGGNPYETVVEAEREVLEVTRRTLERRQMTTVPGTFGDPIRVIQTLPGLARTPFVSGFLVVRGSNPDDTGVYLDGHRIPILFHFLGGPSILNPEFLDELQFYPGGFPARFGRSIGGIVSVESRPPASDGVHGSADVDLLDAGAYLRFPVGKHGAMALAGRRSYIDVFLDAFLPEPDPGSTLVVVPIYYDYQLRYDHHWPGVGKGSLFLVGSSDLLEVLSQDAEAEASLDLQSRVDFVRLIASFRRPLGDRLRLTLSPAIGRDQVRFGGARTEGSPAATRFDITQNALGYRLRIDGKLRDWLILDTGIDLESRVTRYQVLAPLADDIRDFGAGEIEIPAEYLERSVDALELGLHADVALDIARLRLIPGLRLDSHLLNGELHLTVDPRLVARYRLREAVTAKAYVGLFHQPPQPEALDDRFGNPAVRSERGLHTGLGAEWQPIPHWTLDGEFYFIDRRNQVRFTDDVITDPETGDITPLNFNNEGTGDTVGFELLVRREVTRELYGWLSYTFSISRQAQSDSDDLDPTPFDQRHTLNAVASYRPGRGWELGGRYRLATGRPDTPVLGGTFDADLGSYVPLRGEFRSGRRKTFHQLDVRAEKLWTFETWMLGLYLDIQNVLNLENEEGIQYDYRFRESAPITSVPIVPTLGVRGQW